MFRKRSLFFVVSAIEIAILLFSSVAFSTEIEITPVLSGKEYYVMRLGEIQTFKAVGFGWDNDKEQKIPDVEIKSIQWSFDQRFLELVEIKDNAITLKAIKNRTSRLTVTGKIDGEIVSKTIFIVIEGK